MPTTATDNFKPGGLLPQRPNASNECLNVKLKASTTFPQGCLLAATTAAPTVFVPYDGTKSDGSEVPKALLRYGCTTDANGDFAIGPFGAKLSTAPAYFGGSFRTDDLPQSGAGAIDATALTKQVAWHLEEGSVTSGILNIG